MQTFFKKSGTFAHFYVLHEVNKIVMKEQAKMKAKKHAKHPVQYGVDIAKEFNDVKSSIQVLADKINKQTTEFEKQLTKLNVNMEKVLN